VAGEVAWWGPMRGLGVVDPKLAARPSLLSCSMPNTVNEYSVIRIVPDEFLSAHPVVRNRPPISRFQASRGVCHSIWLS